jgi:hypothetical protein
MPPAPWKRTQETREEGRDDQRITSKTVQAQDWVMLVQIQALAFHFTRGNLMRQARAQDWPVWVWHRDRQQRIHAFQVASLAAGREEDPWSATLCCHCCCCVAGGIEGGAQRICVSSEKDLALFSLHIHVGQQENRSERDHCVSEGPCVDR